MTVSNEFTFSFPPILIPIHPQLFTMNKPNKLELEKYERIPKDKHNFSSIYSVYFNYSKDFSAPQADLIASQIS
jgi:hypothetical protein